MPTPATAKWPKPRSDDKFEEIVVDFVRLRWKDPNAQLYERREQHGIAVVSHPPWLSGRVAAAQWNTNTLALADVLAEVEKAKTFPGGLAEFYVVTSGERDEALRSQVRAHFRASPAPFDVEVLFWPDVVADISADDRLSAKHFGPTKALVLIQAEAQRMKKYSECLFRALSSEQWKQLLPDKFRPQTLEIAFRDVVSEVARDSVLLENLNSLRAAAAVADEKIEQILRQLPLEPFRLHPYNMLNEDVSRVTSEADHVARRIDRLLAT